MEPQRTSGDFLIMTSRTSLYAHAIRNQVGRTFGLAAAYTPAQRATAKAMWDVFKAAGYNDDTCAALLGCIDGETSLLLAGRGDHDQAGGCCQWHVERKNMILAGTKIDVWRDLDPVAQARAVIAEMTQKWSWYHHVDKVLRAAPTIRAKIMVLVSQLEQSGSQQRDIDRRTPMAIYWRTQFGAPEAAA